MHLHKWHFIMRAQALHLWMPEMSFPFLHAPQWIASAVMIQPLRSTKLSSKQRPVEGKNKFLTNTHTSWVLSKKKKIYAKKEIVACDRLQSTDKNHFKHCHQSQLPTAVQRQKGFQTATFTWLKECFCTHKDTHVSKSLFLPVQPSM